MTVETPRSRLKKDLAEIKRTNQLNELPIDAVFGFYVNKPGTTLTHGSLKFDYSNPRNFTLCGLNCTGWYGDDDLQVSDIECKKCQKIAEAMRKEMNE